MRKSYYAINAKALAKALRDGNYQIESEEFLKAVGEIILAQAEVARAREFPSSDTFETVQSLEKGIKVLQERVTRFEELKQRIDAVVERTTGFVRKSVVDEYNEKSSGIIAKINGDSEYFTSAIEKPSTANFIQTRYLLGVQQLKNQFDHIHINEKIAGKISISEMVKKINSQREDQIKLESQYDSLFKQAKTDLVKVLKQETDEIKTQCEQREFYDEEVVSLQQYCEGIIESIDKAQTPIETFDQLDSFYETKQDYQNEFDSQLKQLIQQFGAPDNVLALEASFTQFLTEKGIQIRTVIDEHIKKSLDDWFDDLNDLKKINDDLKNGNTGTIKSSHLLSLKMLKNSAFEIQANIEFKACQNQIIRSSEFKDLLEKVRTLHSDSQSLFASKEARQAAKEKAEALRDYLKRVYNAANITDLSAALGAIPEGIDVWRGQKTRFSSNETSTRRKINRLIEKTFTGTRLAEERVVTLKEGQENYKKELPLLADLQKLTEELDKLAQERIEQGINLPPFNARALQTTTDKLRQLSSDFQEDLRNRILDAKVIRVYRDEYLILSAKAEPYKSLEHLNFVSNIYKMSKDWDDFIQIRKDKSIAPISKELAAKISHALVSTGLEFQRRIEDEGLKENIFEEYAEKFSKISAQIADFKQKQLESEGKGALKDQVDDFIKDPSGQFKWDALLDLTLRYRHLSVEQIHELYKAERVIERVKLDFLEVDYVQHFKKVRSDLMAIAETKQREELSNENKNEKLKFYKTIGKEEGANLTDREKAMLERIKIKSKDKYESYPAFAKSKGRPVLVEALDFLNSSINENEGLSSEALEKVRKKCDDGTQLNLDDLVYVKAALVKSRKLLSGKSKFELSEEKIQLLEKAIEVYESWIKNPENLQYRDQNKVSEVSEFLDRKQGSEKVDEFFKEMHQNKYEILEVYMQKKMDEGYSLDEIVATQPGFYEFLVKEANWDGEGTTFRKFINKETSLLDNVGKIRDKVIGKPDDKVKPKRRFFDYELPSRHLSENKEMKVKHEDVKNELKELDHSQVKKELSKDIESFIGDMLNKCRKEGQMLNQLKGQDAEKLNKLLMISFNEEKYQDLLFNEEKYQNLGKGMKKEEFLAKVKEEFFAKVVETLNFNGKPSLNGKPSCADFTKEEIAYIDAVLEKEGKDAKHLREKLNEGTWHASDVEKAEEIEQFLKQMKAKMPDILDKYIEKASKTSSFEDILHKKSELYEFIFATEGLVDKYKDYSLKSFIEDKKVGKEDNLIVKFGKVVGKAVDGIGQTVEGLKNEIFPPTKEEEKKEGLVGEVVKIIDKGAMYFEDLYEDAKQHGAGKALKHAFAPQKKEQPPKELSDQEKEQISHENAKKMSDEVTGWIEKQRKGEEKNTVKNFKF